MNPKQYDDDSDVQFILESGAKKTSREALKKVASDGQARRNQMKKRSLQDVNEHFESNFNTAWPSAVVFQSFPRNLGLVDSELRFIL